MQADAALPDLSKIINTIRSVGKEYGISPTVTAYYKLTTPETDDPVLTEVAFLFDTAIVAEAYTLGADEVLVSGFSLSDATDCDNVTAFIDKAKLSAPKIKLGLAFAPEVYADDASASYLEKIAAGTSFFAVNTDSLDWSYSVIEETFSSTDENGDTVFTTENVVYSVIYDELVNTAVSIKGSISLYGLRFLLNGDNAYSLAMAAEALSSKGAYDYYVITSPEGGHPPDDYEPETTTESDKKDEETKKPQKPETTQKPTVSTAPPETEETDPPVEAPDTDSEPDTTESDTAEPTPPETEPSEETTESTPETETTPPEDTEDTTPPETDAPAETDSDTSASETDAPAEENPVI